MSENQTPEPEAKEDVGVEGEAEAKLSHQLQMRAIAAWQRMKPGTYEEIEATTDPDYEDDTDKIAGSRARVFNMALEGYNDAAVGLIFWNEAGLRRIDNPPARLSFIIEFNARDRQEPRTAVEGRGKAWVAARNIDLGPEGFTVSENILSFKAGQELPGDEPEADYPSSRQSNPEDIKLVQEIIEKLDNDELSPPKNAIDFLDCWAPWGEAGAWYTPTTE